MGLSRVRKFWRAAVVAVVFSSTLLVALPAHALPLIVFPPIFFLNGINGNVTNAGTAGAIKGVIVSAYRVSDGTYVWSSVTDATGHFGLFLATGDYRLQFQDPLKRYGGQWYSDATNYADASNITVTTGNFTTANAGLLQAMTIKYVVRRLDHPLAKVAGANIILQQKDNISSHVVMQTAVANSSGLVTFSGQRPQGVTYLASAIDTSGRYYTGSSNGGYLAFAGGTVTTVYADLTAIPAYDCTVTVPASSKYTRSANVRFTVTGSINKRITSPHTMKIVATRGSTTKTFTIALTPKTSSTSYSGKVKLSKGTWKLFALFGGNSTTAPQDSGVVGRTVVVK
jgi:hypothetical protein